MLQIVFYLKMELRGKKKAFHSRTFTKGMYVKEGVSTKLKKKS